MATPREAAPAPLCHRMAVPASAGCCTCTTTQRQGPHPAVAQDTVVPEERVGAGKEGGSRGVRDARWRAEGGWTRVEK